MIKQEIMRKIYEEIDSLPPIPDNITKIRKMVNDPKSEIYMISSLVKQDATLTADILKVANSAWYISRTKVDTVERAISLIGLRRLSSITLTLGAKKILGDKYKKMEYIWRHSYQCAFYSQNLMKMRMAEEEEIEVAYICGLLHDIGKFILLSINPSLIENISKLSIAKNLSITEIEKQVLGLNHEEIGEKIFSKWKFPPALIGAIAHHHSPLLARNESWFILVYVVYFANLICPLKEPSVELMKKIEPTVLEALNIKSEQQFETTLKLLIDSYYTSPQIKVF
ncbi:MAG: HDOD domain-containing protein [Spirochaetota bacterium]|nr:HDOD domain-containing protein [Spirochaetota bacterium]